MNYPYPIRENGFGVDSFQLRLPLEKVKIKQRLGKGTILVCQETGEVLEEKVTKSYLDSWTGIKSTYQVKKQRFGNMKVAGDFLLIGLNSKILGGRYFDGITDENILNVFAYVENSGIVSMSPDAFLDGWCTDFDVKRDLLPQEPVMGIIKRLEKNAVPVKKARRGMSAYKKKRNLGIQFALRTTDSDAYPFLKFYEKVRELKYHSMEFYQEYFLNVDLPSEILRCETTIKNKTHFKKLGAKDNTLREVMSNLDLISNNAFKRAFKRWIPDGLEPAEPLTLKGIKLNTKDRLILKCIALEMRTGLPFDLAVSNTIAVASDKTIRSKLKKRIEQIFTIKNKQDFKKQHSKGAYYEWFNGTSAN